MFENYTVTASRHPSSLPLCDDDIFGPGWSVPRTSSPCDLYSRQTNIAQLSQQFSQLQHESVQSHGPTESKLSYLDSDLRTPLSPRAYVGSLSPSRRRIQRQHGVRMLCDSTHLRSIQDMVEKMVKSGDQCAVSPARITSDEPTPSQPDDEGYSSLEENNRNGSISSVSSNESCLAFRRSMDPTSGACVSKSARVKKSRNMRGLSKQY